MPRSSRDTLVLVTLIIVGAALRVALARGDLWLDEVWSLAFARRITWPWEILTVVQHDNNHPLNTLALYVVVTLLGGHAPSLVYRLLPLLAGIATIPALYWTERQRNDPLASYRAWIAATLCSCSFLAVVYSSEARGYAPAALFSLLAFGLVRGREMTNGRDRALFGLVCALALLSHLTFLFVYAGLAAWTLVRFLRPGGRDLRAWIALHQIPLVVIAGVYLIYANKLTYGGGPAFRISDVAIRTVSLVAAGVDGPQSQWFGLIVGILIIVSGIWLLIAAQDDEWIFFVTAMVIAPVLVLLTYRARFLDVRYFFVLVPFFWLLAARVLSSFIILNRMAQLRAALVLVAFVVANLAHLWSPIRYGRGHYKEATVAIASMTPGATVTVSSDHDFRNGTLIEYYAEERPLGKSIEYIPSADAATRQPAWFVTHSIDPAGDVVPSPTMSLKDHQYHFVRTFRYGGISGWNWHLYKRQ